MKPGCSEVLELSWDTMSSSALWASACVYAHACARTRTHTCIHVEHLLASLGSPAQLPTLPSKGLTQIRWSLNSQRPTGISSLLALALSNSVNPLIAEDSAGEGVCQLCSVVRNTELRIFLTFPKPVLLGRTSRLLHKCGSGYPEMFRRAWTC